MIGSANVQLDATQAILDLGTTAIILSEDDAESIHSVSTAGPWEGDDQIVEVHPH